MLTGPGSIRRGITTARTEQRVVDRDRECRIRGEQLGHDQIGEGQSDRVTRPAGVDEHSGLLSTKGPIAVCAGHQRSDEHATGGQT